MGFAAPFAFFLTALIGLELAGAKRITGAHVTGLISGCEPTLTLLGCAVRKRMRLHALTSIALERVVANLFGRIQRLF